MKIIYSGGYDKTRLESIESNVIFRYGDLVRAKLDKCEKVIYVTLAKTDDDYYLPQINQAIRKVGFELLGHANLKSANWSEYDLIFLLGGDQSLLKESLINSGFEIDNIKKSATIIGDSAGAMVMGSWFYDADFVASNDLQVEFHQGLYATTKNIFLVHANNPHYTSPELIAKVKKFATKNNLSMISLAENQENIFDDINPSQ